MDAGLAFSQVYRMGRIWSRREKEEHSLSTQQNLNGDDEAAKLIGQRVCAVKQSHEVVRARFGEQ